MGEMSHSYRYKGSKVVIFRISPIKSSKSTLAGHFVRTSSGTKAFRVQKLNISTHLCQIRLSSLIKTV